jgi:hypothetical protein
MLSSSVTLDRRLDEIQGIEHQIADIRSSLDGALGNSIDDDSKVAAAGFSRAFCCSCLVTSAISQAEAKKVLKAVSSWMRVKSEKATLDEIKVRPCAP